MNMIGKSFQGFGEELGRQGFRLTERYSERTQATYVEISRSEREIAAITIYDGIATFIDMEFFDNPVCFV